MLLGDIWSSKMWMFHKSPPSDSELQTISTTSRWTLPFCHLLGCWIMVRTVLRCVNSWVMAQKTCLERSQWPWPSTTNEFAIESTRHKIEFQTWPQSRASFFLVVLSRSHEQCNAYNHNKVLSKTSLFKGTIFTWRRVVSVPPVAFNHYMNMWLRPEKTPYCMSSNLLFNHNLNKNAPLQSHTLIMLLLLEIKMGLYDITIRLLIALLPLH